MRKMKKTASTEMDFIQKRREILPNRDQRFKDESSIFLTSINMSQKVLEVLTFSTLKMAKNCQNRDFLPIPGQFFSN
jgi:lipid II:glycine glycyltransferase (peptidoglycan interpeptide bridge formation enzyme)